MNTGGRCWPVPVDNRHTVVRISANTVHLANAPEHLPGIVLVCNHYDAGADDPAVVVQTVPDDAAVVRVTGLVNTAAVSAAVKDLALEHIAGRARDFGKPAVRRLPTRDAAAFDDQTARGSDSENRRPRLLRSSARRARPVCRTT